MIDLVVNVFGKSSVNKGPYRPNDNPPVSLDRMNMSVVKFQRIKSNATLKSKFNQIKVTCRFSAQHDFRHRDKNNSSRFSTMK